MKPIRWRDAESKAAFYDLPRPAPSRTVVVEVSVETSSTPERVRDEVERALGHSFFGPRVELKSG